MTKGVPGVPRVFGRVFWGGSIRVEQKFGPLAERPLHQIVRPLLLSPGLGLPQHVPCAHHPHGQSSYSRPGDSNRLSSRELHGGYLPIVDVWRP